MPPRKQNGTIKHANGRKRKSVPSPQRVLNYLPGGDDPRRDEWEKMKAHCRNLTPAAAVGECAHLSAEYRRRFAMPEID